MRHMTLDEWDRTVAPYLNTIQIRAGFIANDASQIREWVEKIPAVPNFETRAKDKLDRAARELRSALSAVEQAIENYESKENVS